MIRAAFVIALVFLTGCSSTGVKTPTVVQAATPAQRTALLEQVKKLDGTWVSKNEQGEEEVGTIYKVSSNGHVVREVMFPGSTHEMTNVYHMDGPTLVMTHYCSVGNQPRLRAAASDKPGTIEFRPDGASNVTSPDEMYMGEMTLTIKDNDHIVQSWRSYEKGKLSDHNAVFELTRKQ